MSSITRFGISLRRSWPTSFMSHLRKILRTSLQNLSQNKPLPTYETDSDFASLSASPYARRRHALTTGGAHLRKSASLYHASICTCLVPSLYAISFVLTMHPRFVSYCMPRGGVLDRDHMPGSGSRVKERCIPSPHVRHSI